MQAVQGFFLLFALVFNGCTTAESNSLPTPVNSQMNQPQGSLLNETDASNETVTVGKFVFKLENCHLTYQGAGLNETFDFKFPEKCQFSKDAKGNIRQYKASKGTIVLAVEGSKIFGEKIVGSGKIDCETYIRGIVVSNKKVSLSWQTQKVATCLPAVWDETMFAVFAAKTQIFVEARKKQNGNQNEAISN